MSRGRGHFGTSIRREPDVAAIGRSLRAEGIDPRTWVSYGTVGTFDGDSGEPNFADLNAVWVSPEGVEADVVLSPSGIPVTCRYAGVQGGGSVSILAPLHPGDEVLVVLPEGSEGGAPVIVAILNAAHTHLPVEDDGKPVFRNDRLSVFATDVPIEVRTAGGARVVVAQDGTVNMNQGDNGVARLGDTTKLTMSSTDIITLASSMVAAGLVAPGGGGVPPDPIEFDDGEITSASDTVKAGG